jgi:hypothetical protein
MSQFFGKIKTRLDLNGPSLEFVTQPVSVATTGVGIGSTGGPDVIMSGIATVSFGSTGVAVNKGSIGYQWYESSLGKLPEGDKYVGTSSTTLNIKNIITPTDNDRKYYLEADYVPGQPGARTGNALNEPLNSSIATVTVTPILDIIAQPSSTAIIQNVDTTFTINAQLSNGTTGGISYQWQIDEENVTDGDISNNDPTFVSITLEDQGLSSTQPSPYGQAVASKDYLIPTDATNIVIDLASGPGGNGGTGLPPTDFGTPGKGGDGINQIFTPVSGSANVIPRKIRFIKGRRGGDGDVADTPDGLINGGSGSRAGGSSGTNINFGASQGNHGGGGGGSTTFDIMYHNKETDVWAVVFAACLGGGGGGGAPGKLFQTPNNGQDGEDSNHTGVTGNPLNNQSKGGDGEGEAGSGGGGGGYSGDTGQVANGGTGTDSRGGGGQDGRSSYRLDVLQNITNLLPGAQNTGGAGEGAYLPLPSDTNSDGWGRLSYNSVSESAASAENITISGTQTNTLTIRSNSALTRRIRCVVSHTSEDISDLISNTVNFICQPTAGTSNVNIEIIGPNTGHSSQNTASLKEHNLNDGEYTFDMVPSSSTSTVLYYCLYSPDKDVDIEMDLYGGKGTDIGGHSGGQGGYSRIRFTLEQNTEYIISGLNDIINTPFVYKKASLIACVGQGGHAGGAGAGGDGGGTNISGFTGQGLGAGAGGVTPGLGEPLTTNGVYGSGFTSSVPTSIYYYTPQTYPQDTQAEGDNGGRTLSCPKGVFYAQEGLSPCQDITDPTLTHFRFGDSSEVWNSALIHRGYKPGYDIIQTAGGSEGRGVTGRAGRPGRGGNGATGGDGGTFQGNPDLQAGGGGGSGYQDGSVTVVDQQQGGSNGDSKVVIRLAV